MFKNKHIWSDPIGKCNLIRKTSQMQTCFVTLKFVVVIDHDTAADMFGPPAEADGKDEARFFFPPNCL